ncbi:hypothetical protein ACFL4G_01350, partial [Thermodesulfobacteriota bacterium]
MSVATRIAGIGVYVPDRKIDNDHVMGLLREHSAPYLTKDELSALMEKAARNLVKAGCGTRYWCREDEYCTDIAHQASVRALEDAGVDPADVELIIFTGMSKAFVEPATANVLQHELGAVNANVIDTQDACSSFIKSVEIADSFIRTGTYRTVLVACGERTYDWADFQCKSVEELKWKFGSLTIGDAAGAMVLQATEDPMYTEASHHMRFTYKTLGEAYAACNIGLNFRVGERYKLQSHSNKLFSKVLELGSQLFIESDWKHLDVRNIFAHDIGRLIEEYELPLFEKIMEGEGRAIPDYHYRPYFYEYGNVASASLPLGM